ncbi:DNA-binding protein [Burkholderia ubonensis]|uniref:KfrA N-terminal DNA-binding domain-containing protein n=1 Tax=Burkholderia ubonensis TaxID=101571 RepID=A0ABD4E7Z8_9BURK|nr:hypothetical protein WJ68_05635 [Burkholderia ubonensis]
MSRISNTRLRTREAASHLVAAGRRPHELTVDLIYAEIRQGSRTTINDELKLWKDEQVRNDALAAALPAPVADAMLVLWALAIDHGEQVLARRGEQREHADAATRAASLARACAALEAEVRTLRALLEERDLRLTAMTTELVRVRTECETARQTERAAAAGPGAPNVRSRAGIDASGHAPPAPGGDSM